MLQPAQPLQRHSRLAVPQSVAADGGEADGVLLQVVAAVGRHAGGCDGESLEEGVDSVLSKEDPPELQTGQAKDGGVLPAVLEDLPLEVELPRRLQLLLVPPHEVRPVLLPHGGDAVVLGGREWPHVLPIGSLIEKVGEVALGIALEVEHLG